MAKSTIEKLSQTEEKSKAKSKVKSKIEFRDKDKVSTGLKLVIVESPTKAKTIRKFLGRDFVVESCMGHVRDLPQSSKDIPAKFKKEKWAQLGVNVEKDFEPLYCVPKDKEKVVRQLREKLEGAGELYLATDEDREGESISWHLVELLKPKVPIRRMVFHEITKEAIQKSLTDTRKIDSDLVKAQEARRILDRLVGYTLSPLLWKKVAYGLSAGRVQSVAVRLVAEREHDRLRFVVSQYWGLTAELRKDGIEFESRLQHYRGQRVATGKDFDGETGKLLKGSDVISLDQKITGQIVKEIEGQALQVTEVEEKPIHRKPAPPFITSTLQQESNRKLGMGSRETMQVAQKLYEQGFITYMRTDSTFLSGEAISAARSSILRKYGKEYLPKEARLYQGKQVKGAQEAHEAIRPAGAEFIEPEQSGLSGQQLRLYELIWMRTMASQMVDSRQKQVQAKFEVKNCGFSASGMTIEFPGFLRAYVEGSDDPEAELSEREFRLPPLRKADQLRPSRLVPTSHETKPPARYTEASLVQKMEKEGIGRPSTYASVISTIIDRGYVRKFGSALAPTFTALVVSKLLKNHLPEYVDLGFTSDMEKSLDNIAEGDLDSLKYLQSIYFGPKGLRAQVEKQEEKIDPEEARTIRIDALPQYSFHVGRYGAYVSTSRGSESVNASLPENEAPADLNAESIEKLIEQKIKGADALGIDPTTGEKIYVLSGRYGPYVQRGETQDKPKRMSLPQGVVPENVDLSMALNLLSLPKNLGPHPTSLKEVKVGLGRFGPFVVHDGDYRSIPKGESLFTVDLKRALELLSQPKKGRGRAAAIKDFGQFPDSKDMIQLFNGPYGPYLKCGKTNASLPEGTKPEELTAELAVQIIRDKKGLASEKTSRGEKPKVAKKAKPVLPKLAKVHVRAKKKKKLR